VDIGTAYSKSEDTYYIFIGHMSETPINTVIKLSEEHTEYAWVDITEFLKLDATAYLKDFVCKALEPIKISLPGRNYPVFELRTSQD
jgi:hypothetical protein